MSPDCHRELLSRSPCAEVARCRCGHIHLSIGPVTLRLDAMALHALWHTVGDALRALEADAAEVGAPDVQGARRAPGIGPGGWEQ